MNDWTAGYVSDVAYPYGYSWTLCPSLLSLALLNQGVNANLDKPLRYLELGFGQGLSFNIHAAACTGEFWGVDFNPSHAANAKEMADPAGSGARIFDLSFAEFAAREDIPEFDVIALHGVWSWISDENRDVIVDLARRKLAIGGVLYISYNCTPGWSPAMPLRHLMTLHAEMAGPGAQGTIGKIDAALAFTQKVIDSGAAYFRSNPAVVERLKGITTQDRHYVAHEYFNRDWLPMPFSEVAKRLGAAKLDFAASANLLAHVDGVCLTKEGQRLLAEIATPPLRESVRDYIVNQQFRMDVFVKGPRPLSRLERLDRLRRQGFVLVTAPEDVPMTLQGPLEVALQKAIYEPLLEVLAEDGHAPKSVTQILGHPKWKQQPLETLCECLILLTGAGHVHPVQQPEIVKSVRSRCGRLNAYLCKRARDSEQISYLASPVTGGGILVNRVQQLFLASRHAGKTKPAEWAMHVWDILHSQNQCIVKDGKAIETVEDNIAELTVQAKSFAEKHLALFHALGIN